MARKYFNNLNDAAIETAQNVYYCCCPPTPGPSGPNARLIIDEMTIGFGNAVAVAAQMVQIDWVIYEASGLTLPTGGSLLGAQQELQGDAAASFMSGVGPFSNQVVGTAVSIPFQGCKYSYLGWTNDKLKGGIILAQGQCAVLNLTNTLGASLNWNGTITVLEVF